MANPSADSKKIAVRVLVFLNEVLERQGKAKLKSGQSLAATGIVDSLFVIDLILFLEGEFGLDFSKETISPLDVDSVDQIVELVQAHAAPVKGSERDA